MTTSLFKWQSRSSIPKDRPIIIKYASCDSYEVAICLWSKETPIGSFEEQINGRKGCFLEHFPNNLKLSSTIRIYERAVLGWIEIPEDSETLT
jgi:hypothetical protein